MAIGLLSRLLKQLENILLSFINMKPKTKEEIALMRKGGPILSEILHMLADMVTPGMQTVVLEKEARKLIAERNVKPSFLYYDNYPAVLCVSVNDEVVHAVPSSRVLKEGDVVSLDLGIWYENLALDCAVTVGVGTISEKNKKLIEVTRKALDKGLKVVKSGITTGDIGSAIQSYVENNGLEIVRELVGHGVGYEVHEPPQIPNYGSAGKGVFLPENLVIAIEPMVTYGSGNVVLSADGFGYKTINGEYSAHFEVTAVVTKKGVEVLTPLFS